MKRTMDSLSGLQFNETLDNSSIISVDVNELGLLIEQGKDIVFTPTAEGALLKLLELDEMIKQALKTAKDMITDAALKYDPNFSSVQSDRIKVMYRAYGQKYGTDINVDPSTIDPELVEAKTTYVLKPSIDFDNLTTKMQDTLTPLLDKHVTFSLISKEIDKKTAKDGKLPKGIVSMPRVKSMSFKRVEDVVEDDE